MSMSFNEAIEHARRTGDTRAAMDHWDRNRLALAHDTIRDVLDHLPADADRVTVARLEDAVGALRHELAERVTAA